ncbi:helix-turn-helix transcriptional regulator [Burkholderia perseverans]|uniref:helix-turn-helix transcriptional regulator n=1 Tax=Burkholderia perseverans TaxID=2615214 RepID=UPI001FF00D72|nr:AraC family transcriptional regulator [Burkholderia perseverans]
MRSVRLPDAARYWRTPLLPGADLVTATYRDHTFPPHWHDAYTLPVIETGAERYTYRGGRRLADTGSVPVINPGEIHTGSRATEDGWRYRVSYVPIDFLRALADEIAGKPQPVPWFPDDAIGDADFAHRLLLAYRLLEASGIDIAHPGDEAPPEVRVELAAPAVDADPLAAEMAMLDALSTLLVRHAIERPRAAVPAADEPRIARMREWLAADLTAPVTLAELAQAVGLSPFHAARLFTRATGMAPHAWRNQLRIQRALAPLRAGAPVAQVAAASGFVDQSHFTRHFKRMFGVPPGRWQGTRK